MAIESDDEMEFLKAIENGESVSVANLDDEINVAKQAARNFFKKEKRINIRLSKNDLDLIKRRAAVEGLPYQSMISSVLHKFAAGHIDIHNN